MSGLYGVGETMVTGTRCKACKAVVVRGATHCARCGSPQGMTVARLKGESLLQLGLGETTVPHQHLAEPHPISTVSRAFRRLAQEIDGVSRDRPETRTATRERSRIQRTFQPALEARFPDLGSIGAA
jgi:hypothetical protein